MWQDTTNGVFELCGGIFITLHCIKLYRQKMVRGTSIAAVTTFVLWGFWNLYYYPHLNQWLSFFGGIGTVTANIVWVAMLIYYTRKEYKRNHL